MQRENWQTQVKSRIGEKLSSVNSAALTKMYQLHEKTGSSNNNLVRFFRRMIIGPVLGHPALGLVDHHGDLEYLHSAGLSDKEVSAILGLQVVADSLLVNSIIILAGMPLADHVPLDGYLASHASIPIVGLLSNFASSTVGNYGEGALLVRPIYGLAMELVRDLFYWFVVPGLIHKNQALAAQVIPPLDPGK